jgi:hypothetical protein
LVVVFAGVLLGWGRGLGLGFIGPDDDAPCAGPDEDAACPVDAAGLIVAMAAGNLPMVALACFRAAALLAALLDVQISSLQALAVGVGFSIS